MLSSEDVCPTGNVFMVGQPSPVDKSFHENDMTSGDACHTDDPERNGKEAGHYYKKAIELFSKVPDPIQAANSELNLQTMYHLSGQPVDVERVKALTRIMEEAKDKRAEKGHKILKEISDKK